MRLFDAVENEQGLSVVADNGQRRVPVITPIMEDPDRFDIRYAAYQMRSGSLQIPEHQLCALARRVVGGTEKAIATHLDLCAELRVIDLETSATAGVPAGEIFQFLRPVRFPLRRLAVGLRVMKPLKRGGRRAVAPESRTLSSAFNVLSAIALSTLPPVA